MKLKSDIAIELLNRLRNAQAGESFTVQTPYQRQAILFLARVYGINIHTERAGKAFKVHRLAD